MVFYDELHEREQRRSIEADCQRHLRRENWPEEPNPDGCWNCGSYSHLDRRMHRRARKDRSLGRLIKAGAPQVR